MDRHFDKLSISASGLLGDRHSQPHHYQTQPQQYQQQQQHQQQQLPHHPVRQSQQPTTVYGANRRDYARENGGAAEQHEESAGESVRQRTGRVRQSRSSTWGGGDGANGQLPPAATSAVVASAELDETVDLRRRAPSQAESPRTPRTPGGGSPRYAAGPDDQHHLAAISPRGAAGTASVPHSYHRRDRHPSSSGGGGGLMVTEDDFRHVREGSNHSTVQGDAGGGRQQSVLGRPGDVSSRLLQKYKTDSLRVEVTEADRRQQHPAAGLSKSHDGFIVPRRLPPIGGAASSSAAGRGNDDNDDDDDDDDIECDGGGEDEEDVEEADANQQRHQRKHRQQGHQHQKRRQDEEQSAHKGRTRTN